MAHSSPPLSVSLSRSNTCRSRNNMNHCARFRAVRMHCSCSCASHCSSPAPVHSVLTCRSNPPRYSPRKTRDAIVARNPLSLKLRRTRPPIAQLVEQLPFKEFVPGSNPGGRTKSFLERLFDGARMINKQRGDHAAASSLDDRPFGTTHRTRLRGRMVDQNQSPECTGD